MARPVTAARSVRWRRVCVATVPAVLVLAAFLAVFLGVGDRLPDQLATHMGPDGRADDFLEQGAFLTVAVLLISGLAALFGLMSWFADGSAPRFLAATGAGIAAFDGYLMVMLTLTNVDVADPSTVRFPLWQLGAATAAGACIGVLGWVLAGADPREGTPATQPPPARADRLPLGAGERVMWTRTVHSPALWVAGAVTVAGIALLAPAVGWWTVVPAGLLGFVLVAAASVRVTADARGLTVASAVLPRPRLHVPLEQITEAGPHQVNALRDFGGWGYRARADRSGLIMRSGSALTVNKASGSTFVVTIDDAATAAAVLNALADRARGGQPKRS